VGIGEDRNAGEGGGGALANMGQELFNPPDVFSWPGNLSWVTAQTMLVRYRFASDLTSAGKSRNNGMGFNPLPFVDIYETRRAAMVDRLLRQLCLFNVDQATKNQLMGWLGPSDFTQFVLQIPDFVNVRIRGLVGLMMTLPHYHVH